MKGTESLPDNFVMSGLAVPNGAEGEHPHNVEDDQTNVQNHEHELDAAVLHTFDHEVGQESKCKIPVWPLQAVEGGQDGDDVESPFSNDLWEVVVVGIHNSNKLLNYILNDFKTL